MQRRLAVMRPTRESTACSRLLNRSSSAQEHYERRWRYTTPAAFFYARKI
jgi:hypothetical protein